MPSIILSWGPQVQALRLSFFGHTTVFGGLAPYADACQLAHSTVVIGYTESSNKFLMRMLFSLWGCQAKFHINGKPRFASIHAIVGTKICGIVLGTVKGMYLGRKIILPVLLIIRLPIYQSC